MTITYSNTKAAITMRAKRVAYPGKIKEYAKTYYKKHTEKCKAISKRWRQSHLEYHLALSNLDVKIRYWTMKSDAAKVRQLEFEKLMLQETLENRQTWGNFRSLESSVA